VNKKATTFLEYQALAMETAIYPTDGISGIAYTTMGLAGEAGEVSEKVKKIIRDSTDLEKAISDKRTEIAKELGDVLWYVAAICREFGLSLEEVAEINIEKLKSRQKRGKLKGSGDNR